MEKLLVDCTSKLKMQISAHPNGNLFYYTAIKRLWTVLLQRTRAAHREALVAHIADFDVPAILQASHL